MKYDPSQRPASADHHPFYADYIAAVPDGDVLMHLELQIGVTGELLQGIDEEQAGTAYAPGKWTIKELVAHMIDTERIFAYRALSIARDDPAPLPGMDQDLWAAASDANARSFDHLREEFALVRLGNVRMFRGLSDEAWARTGVANDCPFLVRVVPWILAGHELHHARVLSERYLAS